MPMISSRRFDVIAPSASINIHRIRFDNGVRSSLGASLANYFHASIILPFIMDATPEHPPEQRSESSQQESASVTGAVSNVGSSIGEIAGSSVGEVKNKLNSVYTSGSVQNVWEQVRSVATGGKTANDQGAFGSAIFS